VVAVLGAERVAGVRGDASAEELDDELRIDEDAPVLIEAGAARGRRMTSWPSLKTDLKNAGADWVDQETVVDQGLVTSRSPDDIPAFNREVIKLFSEARVPSHAE